MHMPLVQITMVAGRTPQQKKDLLDAVTAAVRDSIRAPQESVRVWIVETPGDAFMAAGILAADRESGAK
jgi:4-oxalocrotonate tautomerase